MTPEWAFSELMVFHGFLNSAVAEKAISEFAKIDHCRLARVMRPRVPEPPTVRWTLA